MATTPPNPNDKNQPQKKPAGQNPGASNPAGGAGQAAEPGGQRGQSRPASRASPPEQPKPAAPGAKPPAAGEPGQAGRGREPASPAERPPRSPRPSPSTPTSTPTPSKLGQMLVDLGFIDDAQLETHLEEMRTSDRHARPTVAVDRGLVTEDQLLQATAELHGLKRRQPRGGQADARGASSSSRRTWPSSTRSCPLTFEDDTLTVAMSDPNNLPALDDLRNLLGIRRSSARAGPAQADRGGPDQGLLRARKSRSSTSSQPSRPPTSTLGNGTAARRRSTWTT